MDLTFTLPLTLLALLIEAAFGYPDALLRRIGHPVIWMGALIDWLDRRFNREHDTIELRRRNGAIALLALLAVVISITAMIAHLGGGGFSGLVVLSMLATSLLKSGRSF